MRYRLALLLLFIGFRPSIAELIPLRAGPVSMVFDSDNAMLRYLRIGQTEVLQGINAPIRNQFWGTVSPEVANVKVADDGNAFKVTFDAACRERDVDFVWKGQITGSVTGRIVFTFGGEARSTFLKNRIGFCILHGPSAAGKRWTIEHTGGSKSPGRFPRFISAHQPAKNIRAIAHELADGVWAHVRCEGDVFEMEDQRNWTDASFKTYCTPLEIPYPVEIKQGATIVHRVEVSLEGDLSPLLTAVKPDEKVTLELEEGGQSSRPLPGIGLQVSSQAPALRQHDISRLHALQLDHLRVTVAPGSDVLEETLKSATAQARSLAIPLHVGVQLAEEPEAELGRLARVIESIRPPAAVWLILATDAAGFRLARKTLGPIVGEAIIGVGEDTNFTELNRNRPTDTGIEVVSYGLNPQCHASDDLTMIECLAIQGDTVRSARQFIDNRRLLVGPITLKSQKVNQSPLPGQLPSNVDARQPTLFAAGWTLGSIKYLSEAGVAGMTYYETLGWKGVMSAGKETVFPRSFPAQPNDVFPTYHLLRDVGEFAGGKVRRVSSSESMSVVGLALEREGRKRLLAANLTNRARTVRVRGIDAGAVTVYRLDGANLESATRNPEVFSRRPGERIAVAQSGLEIPLPAWGIVRIDH